MNEKATENTTSSRFFLNVIAQGALAYALTFFSVAQAIGGGNEFLQIFVTLHKLFYCSFLFGLAYGFFRLLGIKGGPVELYYQNFPFGFLYRNQEEAPSTDSSSSPMQAPSRERKEFDWDKLFSPEYLRYAGLLLIISAVFSLLFRIEWSLLYKLTASFVVAVVAIGGAEFYKRKGAKALHAYLFLFGVAALQFGITLTGRYLVESGSYLPPELVMPLLALKLGLSVVMLPLLLRYRADFSAAVYFTILYFAPLSLVYAGFSITFFEMVWFIPVATAAALLFSHVAKLEGLAVFNTAAANVLLLSMIEARIGVLWLHSSIAKYPEEVNFALASLIVVYLLHLFFVIIEELINSAPTSSARCLHVFLSHIFLVIGLPLLIPYFPMLTGQIGVILLFASLFPFASYLLLLSFGAPSRTQEGLLQSAIIIATLGLFLETKGPWSALVFLLYACGILWLGLVRKQKTIRIFAFFVLTASLFKLYTECYELFDSISGTTAILIVGGLLLVLANQMEKIKELMRE